MVFSSVIFLCLFYPLCLEGIIFCPKREAKNLWLIAASLLFYVQWTVVCIASAFFPYSATIWRACLFPGGRECFTLQWRSIWEFWVFFKYPDISGEDGESAAGRGNAVPSIVLPVGISFFTFQGLSYVIDVYRNERLKSTRFRDVLLYIALFPQLVAGPIVRYEDVDESKSRRHTLEQLANGLRRFIIGLSKADDRRCLRQRCDSDL